MYTQDLQQTKHNNPRLQTSPPSHQTYQTKQTGNSARHLYDQIISQLSSQLKLKTTFDYFQILRPSRTLTKQNGKTSPKKSKKHFRILKNLQTFTWQAKFSLIKYFLQINITFQKAVLKE